MPIWSHMNRPATWNNGVVQAMTSSSANSKACAPRQEASARLRCETSTPLGAPVEPLEKVTAAASSGCTSTGGSLSGAPAVKASSEAGPAAPPMTTIRSSAGKPASRARASSARSAWTNSSSAPTPASISARPAWLARTETWASGQPARAAPKWTAA